MLLLDNLCIIETTGRNKFRPTILPTTTKAKTPPSKSGKIRENRQQADVLLFRIVPGRFTVHKAAENWEEDWDRAGGGLNNRAIRKSKSPGLFSWLLRGMTIHDDGTGGEEFCWQMIRRNKVYHVLRLFVGYCCPVGWLLDELLNFLYVCLCREIFAVNWMAVVVIKNEEKDGSGEWGKYFNHLIWWIFMNVNQIFKNNFARQ